MFNRIITARRALAEAWRSPANHRGLRVAAALSPAVGRRMPGRQDASQRRARWSTTSRSASPTPRSAAINLEKQPANIKDRELRFRKLTIEPGGIVPWHSHDDRPALIYVSRARSSNTPATAPTRSCTRPARSRPEVAGTSHWWKNLGNKTVMLYVGDVRKDPHDKHM